MYTYYKSIFFWYDVYKKRFWHFFIILFYNLFETYNVHEFYLLNTT